MADIITLSDCSDDSDDLPSFAERVKRLISEEKKERKRKSSPKKTSVIHDISDSDDSRDTLPFTRHKSASPQCSSPDLPNLNTDAEDNKFDMNDDVLHYIGHRTSSPDFGLGTQDCKQNEKGGSVSSDDDFPSKLKNMVPPLSLPDIQEPNPNMRHYDMSSDDDDLVMQKIAKHSKEKRNNKDEEKEIRKKIRFEKKKEKDMMKALKASEKEVLKNLKPEECLKNMKIVLDHNILYLDGSQSVLNLLDRNNLKYSIEENICKYSVNWYRKTINIASENDEIIKEEREVLSDSLIMIIPNEQFLKMVHAYVQKAKGRNCDNASLAEYAINIKSLYPDTNITCVTVGFSKYMRNIKETSSFEMKAIAKQVHKNASEEAVIELQLQTPFNFKFLDDISEFGNLLQHFTKAIAEAPQKKEKQLQKSSAFSWYADSDSHCPIKLSKDRSSFIKLWRQQVQQFNNVGPEAAEAIVSRYPSPRLLLKAYRSCATSKDAENLLQDIVVRRNYGPLGTQKRIGPELSFKLYLFFTSRDGSKLLKR